MKRLPRKKFKKREIDYAELNPHILFEVVNSDKIEVSVQWPPGTDLTAFSHMLALIINGELLEPTLKKVHEYGTSINESDKYTTVASQVTRILQPNGKKHAALVPPRKAIKHILRLHYDR